MTRRQRSAENPKFFKVLLGDFNTRLKIPPKFMKHIANEASQRVFLQGPNQSSWQVELKKTIDGNFLSAGWSKFVKDHSLKEYEFLLFRYDGNMHFDVMIFDTSACEREDVFNIKTPTKFTWKGKNKRGPTLMRSLDANCVLQHQSRRTKSLLSDNEDTLKQLQGLPPSPKANSIAKAKTKMAELRTRKARYAKVYLSSRRPVTTDEISKAEKAANSFRSPFPCTIIRMKASYVSKIFMLRLPSCFSRMHLPREKTNMVLKDPSGKVWEVVYIPRRKSSKYTCGFLSGGWAAFVCDNNLEEGDFCAFELISEVELRVHIFRVVEETTPLAQLCLKCD